MASSSASPQPHSAVLFRDGFGERRLARDATGQLRELLCIRGDLANNPAFEAALRERANQLADFRHPYFVPVHTVERSAEAAYPLVVVAERFNGIRVAQLLWRTVHQSLALDIDTTVALLRQFVPAVAALQSARPGVVHGALTPERVLFTSNGRLMVTDYVLGSALPYVRFEASRFWRELRLPLPGRGGPITFEPRLDVFQIGIVALTLILGRNLREDERPERIGDVVAAAWALVPKGGLEPVPPALRDWLVRALQLDAARAFSTAAEAAAALEDVADTIQYPGRPESLAAFLDRYKASAPPDDADVVAPTGVGTAASPSLAVAVPAPPPAAKSPAAGLAAFQTEAELGDPDRPEQTLPESIALAPVEPAAGVTILPLPARLLRPLGAGPEKPADLTEVVPGSEGPDEGALPPETVVAPEDSLAPGADPIARAPWRDWRVAASVAAALALAVALGWWLFIAPPAPAAVGRVAITTNPGGATLSIDGRVMGETPLTVRLPAGKHSMELRQGSASKTVVINLAAGGQLAQYIELPVPPAPPPVSVATGWLTVRTPLALDVYQGDQLVGNTSAGRLSLPIGAHVLSLRNDRFGFRTTLSAHVNPGKSTTLAVDVPSEQLVVNARPWAEVWVDGKSVASGPTSSVWISIGTHEVVLRHPELGEQRHQLTVSVGRMARLDVDLRRP